MLIEETTRIEFLTLEIYFELLSFNCLPVDKSASASTMTTHSHINIPQLEESALFIICRLKASVK